MVVVVRLRLRVAAIAIVRGGGVALMASSMSEPKDSGSESLEESESASLSMTVEVVVVEGVASCGARASQARVDLRGTALLPAGYGLTSAPTTDAGPAWSRDVVAPLLR